MVIFELLQKDQNQKIDEDICGNDVEGNKVYRGPSLKNKVEKWLKTKIKQ